MLRACYRSGYEATKTVNMVDNLGSLRDSNLQKALLSCSLEDFVSFISLLPLLSFLSCVAHRGFLALWRNYSISLLCKYPNMSVYFMYAASMFWHLSVFPPLGLHSNKSNVHHWRPHFNQLEHSRNFIADLSDTVKPWPNYRTKLDSTCNIVGCKCWCSGKTLSNIAWWIVIQVQVGTKFISIALTLKRKSLVAFVMLEYRPYAKMAALKLFFCSYSK